MKVSVCITVLNEEGSVGRLLEDLFKQTKKPDEIVVVDGGSTDKTVDIIRHYQKRFGKIKLLVEKCSRARGRNLAVELAKNEIIAMTDAGCRVSKDWLKRITEPFQNKSVDISAGFYTMKADNPMQKAFSVFLGVLPEDFDINFLPSTRSIAFRKSAWEKIGGFPENLEDTAEDTVFNYKALKQGLKFARVKNARVEWGTPKTISNFQFKIFNYAKGDVRSKIWLHPSKGLMSHNVKIASVFARYLAGFVLLVLAFNDSLTLLILLILPTLYILNSFRKVFLITGDLRAGLWGIPVQLISDFAVMGGFLSGVLDKRM